VRYPIELLVGALSLAPSDSEDEEAKADNDDSSEDEEHLGSEVLNSVNDESTSC